MCAHAQCSAPRKDRQRAYRSTDLTTLPAKGQVGAPSRQAPRSKARGAGSNWPTKQASQPNPGPVIPCPWLRAHGHQPNLPTGLDLSLTLAPLTGADRHHAQAEFPSPQSRHLPEPNQQPSIMQPPKKAGRQNQSTVSSEGAVEDRTPLRSLIGSAK